MCYCKEPVERKQGRTENETVVFISSYFFSFFQDYAIKAEIIWSYYHLSSEDQKNNKNFFSSTGKRPTM